MDTRTKILTYEDALGRARGKNARWVTGRFDPLIAGHAQRLRELAEGAELLIVSVMDEGPESILSLEARAQLVAALAVVDWVVIGEAPPDAQDLADGPLLLEFVQSVRQRHREST